MKKILILSYSNLKSDPRVSRQIEFLRDKYDITAGGLEDYPGEDAYFRLYSNRKCKALKYLSKIYIFSKDYDKYYDLDIDIEKTIESIPDKKYAIIIANDIETLPLAVEIKKNCGAKIVFDAHEYAPKEFEDNLKWKILYAKYKEYLCRKYIPAADYRITVCESIADEYKANFGYDFDVVTNAPFYKDIKVKKTDCQNIKIIFHGAANASRKLENMLDTAMLLDSRYVFYLMLVGNPDYINRLKKRYEGSDRIKFIQPVPMKNICDSIANYDIGLYMLEPNSFNNKMALPNKLFEFIQARLMIAIGPSREMKRYVEKYDCGVISKNFKPESMAEILNNITVEEIDWYKINSDIAAKAECAEMNKDKFVKIIKTLTCQEK